MSKTLLVGLDAACWNYLNPLLEAGKMPALQRLIESGTWGTMQSTMPPWTPTAWASIITGKNPGKHGIFDMMWRRPGTYEFTPTNAKARMGTPFWKRLDEAGVRVGMVNAPFTYPCDPLNGFIVCGFGTPNSASDVTYPREVHQWIEQEFGHYEPAVEPQFLRTASPSEIFKVEREHQARQVQIALEMANRYEVEVLAINLMFTDHANHKMPEMEQVQAAYVQADKDVDALIQGFQPDNVMLISDHGSNRLQGNFLLNEWLRDQGVRVIGAAGEGGATWLEADFSGDAALVVGSEDKGLRALTMKCCDQLVRIPMAGAVTSLNVSVATGILLFEAARQRGLASG